MWCTSCRSKFMIPALGIRKVTTYGSNTPSYESILSIISNKIFRSSGVCKCFSPEKALELVLTVGTAVLVRDQVRQFNILNCNILRVTRGWIRLRINAYHTITMWNSCGSWSLQSHGRSNTSHRIWQYIHCRIWLWLGTRRWDIGRIAQGHQKQ